jgi:hypothetical protein
MDTRWIDVGTPSKNVWGVCPLPLLSPDFDGPEPTSPVVVQRVVSDMFDTVPSNRATKAELHRVLNCIQSSTDYGIYLCEDLRDPRRHHIDDYWAEIAETAMGLDDLHKLVGSSSTPLSNEALSKMHQLARLLERLSKRIDRVVTAL